MKAPSLTILEGDCIEQLKTLPDESVHCCVTSPPYWSLRDYGVEGQIGLEKTPEEYVAKMVEVFREVRRVLRNDGVCFCNLGDSYAGGGNYRGVNSEETLTSKQASNRGSKGLSQALGAAGKDFGLAGKQLVGIPWRVAFALQADGWWLRQDIIWHKPNPMPESVTDRCTKAHEYIFLLSKSASYFYDNESIREPHTDPGQYGVDGKKGKGSSRHLEKMSGKGGTNCGSFEKGFAYSTAYLNPSGRNKRSVWTIPSQAYSEAHFATFPEALVKPCILAGTSARGCCPKCGAPWERVVDREFTATSAARNNGAKGMDCSNSWGEFPRGNTETTTTGWKPTCACGCTDTVPCTVIDPFGGSFTTCQVALELGRNAVGIELNPEYVKLARDRCAVTPGLALA